MNREDKDSEEGITRNADGTYTIEIDKEIYEKFEKLMYENKKRMQETKDWPIMNPTTGIEYANLERVS